MASLKRLRKRAHKRTKDDAERLTLAPLTFEQAVKGALATKLPKTDSDEDGSSDGESS